MLQKLILLLLLSATIPVAANELRVHQLKEQITQLAWENIDNTTNVPQVRGQLDRLVAELVQLTPTVTLERILQFSPGGWQQIWSDELNMDPPGAPARDLRQIYQVVDSQGWGFNFGLRTLPNGDQITFALAVVASVDGNRQTTEITQAFSRNRGFAKDEDLIATANNIKNGTDREFSPREAGRFPRGPIGARGVLTLLFIDEDLKIGTSPNVYNGQIELFVMERTPIAR